MIRAPRLLRSRLAAALVAGAGGWACVAAQAQPQGPSQPVGGIYSCVDDKGRRLTSDRPIPECNAREQRVLNSDGSLRTVRPPTLTPEERTEQEARERRAAEQRAAQADAARRDRNLLQRYRTEAAHQSAREAALDSVRAAQRVSRMRQDDLARERKPLMDEAEFYRGKRLPARLKQQIDANDAAASALKDALSGQQDEIERINRFYDVELVRLHKLWAGALPGSMGALAYGSAAQSAASASRPASAAQP